MTAYRKVIVSVTVEFEDKRPGNPDDAATASIEQFWREDLTAPEILKDELAGLDGIGQERLAGPWRQEREEC